LSNWVIAAGALVVLAVAAVIWFVLLRRYGGQGAQVQLDAIRTAGTLVIGTGGAVALLLTARRQRYTELTLVHTNRDATERRITELYTKAADQLGSEKAPVRLAGLHALERLAQNTPDQRQTIVDVICAYLRMPYTPPEEQAPVEDAPAEAHTRYENRRQEQQVRLTAQNILSRNLRVIVQHRRRRWHRTPPPAPAWPGIRLNLTGAFLLEFSLTNCQLDYADFTHAQFTGEAHFVGAQFTEEANFEDAQFAGEPNFESAQFADGANFKSTQFTGGVNFTRAQFTGGALFESAQFTEGADFTHAQFTGGTLSRGYRFTCGAYFDGAQFTGGVLFVGAQFTDRACFADVQFTGGALFGGAQFTDVAGFYSVQFIGRADSEAIPAYFVGAQFNGRPDFGGARVVSILEILETGFGGARMALTLEAGTVWTPGWITRSAKPDNGEDPAFLYLARVEDGNPPDT
jgi:uncharacterized protein YjbI with pentapeptide repeats